MNLVKIDTVTDIADFHVVSLICCELVKIDTLTGIADFHVVSLICCEFSENLYSDRHSRLPCTVIDLL